MPAEPRVFHKFTICLALLILMCCVGMVSAENTESEGFSLDQTPTKIASLEEPFITIDPIGNHTIGEVIIINGTTNLPVSETLMMYIDSYKYATSTHIRSSRGPPTGKFAYNIPVGFIATDRPGLNRWSVNLTDIAMNLSCDEYLVLVDSKEANAGAVFTLFPVGNGTPVTYNPTIMPTPSPKNSTAGDPHALPATQSSPLTFEFSIFALMILKFTKFLSDKR